MFKNCHANFGEISENFIKFKETFDGIKKNL